MHRFASLLAGLVLAGGLAAGCGGGEREEVPPEPLHGIVLVGIDTLRADGLSCYGNPRPTSPRIDALAARGLLFENAISNAAWTLPGFISILTGEMPSARVYQGGLLRSGAEALRDAGYRTAAFTEGGYVSTHFGMDRGFETFWEARNDYDEPPSPYNGVARTMGQARAWLRRNAQEPFFLFVHTYEVHMPYKHQSFTEGLDPGQLGGGEYGLRQGFGILEGSIEIGEPEVEWVRALYAGGVLAVDGYVGGLLDLLEELGVSDRTLVVLTSDHGDQLGEQVPEMLGIHGKTLWDTIVHVPLLIHDPRRRDGGRRIGTQVRTVDVMPTILDLAGIEPPPDADGRSLVPVMSGRETADRPAYSEVRHRDTGELVTATWRGEGRKLHWNGPRAHEVAPPQLYEGRAPVELYDLTRDRGEHHDLAGERPAESARLKQRLMEGVEAIDARGGPWKNAATIDPETRKRLEALGYVEP